MRPARFQSTTAPASSLAVGPCALQSEHHTTQYGTADRLTIKDGNCSTATARLPPQKKHGLIIGVIALLSACETIPPPPQIVHVPINVPCLPSTPLQRPKVFTDAELSALDDYKFTLAIFSDRRVLLDYSAELEAIVSACR